MSFNVWGTVAGVQYALVMETLLGSANKLLGMNPEAEELQYKPVTIDEAGAVAGVTSLSMAGALSGVTTLGMAGALTGVTSLTMNGALSGVTTLSMSGAFSGATTLGASGNATIGGDVLLSTGKVIKFNNVQVLKERITGWAAATGTPTRTTFDTTTVTLPQLAERVKALLDDLITHGVIGV